MIGEVSYVEPSRAAMFLYTLRRLPGEGKAWLADALLAMVVRLVGDTNSVRHAKRELRAALSSKEDGPDRWIAENLIQLMAVFSIQGHSGGSAPWCIESFKKLASFQPLGPLTGADDEWLEHSETCFQNVRCGHVFKYSKDGQAYDIDGRIFREPNGCCYTNRDSRVPVTFPYTPKREYVDVPASEN